MPIITPVNKGDVFGNFTIIEEVPSETRFRNVLCRCGLCGSESIHNLSGIKNGHIKSCGCLKLKNGYLIGGREFSRQDPGVYKPYQNMISRCYCKSGHDYPRYGGRGITVCEEWRGNFPAFREWAYKNGFKKGLTIDRKNVDKDYSPDNCKWSTMKEQNRNKTTTVWIYPADGKIALSEYAENNHIPYPRALDRYKRGYSLEEIVNGRQRA